ncbi:hypothetical protein, partial [uncultured Acetatifactor sp.]|uniref:hypothetical protein n=1 Tax=uncultured Acetatifactor sp. TaxID=1671927 RepID=UPI002630E7E5
QLQRKDDKQLQTAGKRNAIQGSEPREQQEEQQEELYTGRVHRNAEILSTGNAEDICQLILKL